MSLHSCDDFIFSPLVLPKSRKNGGANWSALSELILYLADSKRCFGIIRAALSLLESV